VGSTPGPRLASGRWTDVYDAGGGRVVKRYRDPAAAWIADFEARVMTHARAHRVPVPEVFDVDGGDVVLERIPGPTMLHALARHPRAMRDHARTLATLHRAVHEVPAPAGLDEPFGPGGVLLHLDLHPDNIILSPRGPVIIDWQGAVSGPAPADVAHTWLLIRTSVVPGALRQRIVGTLGQRLFAATFLRHVDAAAARRLLPAVAERRLRDTSLLDAERSRITRIVKPADKGDS